MKKAPLLLAPSILSADFSKLGDEVRACEGAGADWIHVDIMDGHFVPNLTIGPMVVQAIRPLTKLPLDCHLMVSEPEKWIAPFVKAGADFITIHAEVTKDLVGSLRKIRESGLRAGVSVNPETAIQHIETVLGETDLVLVMSVNPGFGGQEFISEVLYKVEWLVKKRGTRPYLIEIDGGIHKGNILRVKQAGCDVIVAGSAVFSEGDIGKSINELKLAAEL